MRHFSTQKRIVSQALDRTSTRLNSSHSSISYAVFFFLFFIFFNDTATTEIYTLSLHDALPICLFINMRLQIDATLQYAKANSVAGVRSDEHTSELQSQFHLVCRLLLSLLYFF